VIDRREIVELAGDLSLRAEIVEKDYVLGWLLAGIGAHPELAPSWVFKGGTCLKKVHFETYRFSEDLDFTVERASDLDDRFLRHALVEVAEWVYRESGIEVLAEQTRVSIYANPRGNPAGEASVYYRGPLQPRGSAPRIKVDLAADERLVTDPVSYAIQHPYSDAPPEGIRVRCYAYPELFAEKIRALGDRARPRDLYDVVHLYRRVEALLSAGNVRDILREKCAFKGLPIPTLHALGEHREDLVADWHSMLAHQLPELPPFESYWDELEGFFLWLKGAKPAAELPAYALDADEEVLRPAIGALGAMGLPSRTLESIRFAAANRLCVDLRYTSLDGRASGPRIEPYSLRRTREGHVVLHAVRVDGGEHRSYRVDRIRGAQITQQVFVPRYAIELSPVGGLPMLSRSTEQFTE
jgi:predicted nucleotidyltransferase component of viral defense system